MNLSHGRVLDLQDIDILNRNDWLNGELIDGGLR